jgi:GDPmannose 4,6-dehydratase
MIALITGITGQDGSYLAELLLAKGYVVHGIKRRSSLLNTQRVDHIYDHPNFELHYGDLTDSLNLVSLINKIRPTEIYNLGAMSHVQVSFEMPEYTANVNALGTLRLLEAIRLLDYQCKFYQASTSELFGNTNTNKQSIDTVMMPVSPYATSKLYAYHITRNYRDAYNIFACNGVLFNHESPRRGETFVTRKITRGIANIVKGKQQAIQLGNIHSKRDWGHAKDYVQAMYLMMQHHSALDLVIGTGNVYSVKEFVDICFDILDKKVDWTGSGGYVDGKRAVLINKKYMRKNELSYLCADNKMACDTLNWKPEYDIRSLAEEMLNEDLK